MFEKDIKLQPTSSATWNDALLLGFIYLLYRIHFSIRTLRFHFLFSLKCRKNLTCLWKILVASSASHSLQEDSPRDAAPVHLSWFLLSFLTGAWNCFKMSGDSPRILGRFSGNSLPLWHLIVFIYLFSFFFFSFCFGKIFQFHSFEKKEEILRGSWRIILDFSTHSLNCLAEFFRSFKILWDASRLFGAYFWVLMIAWMIEFVFFQSVRDSCYVFEYILATFRLVRISFSRYSPRLSSIFEYSRCILLGNDCRFLIIPGDRYSTFSRILSFSSSIVRTRSQRFLRETFDAPSRLFGHMKGGGGNQINVFI